MTVQKPSRPSGYPDAIRLTSRSIALAVTLIVRLFTAIVFFIARLLQRKRAR